MKKYTLMHKNIEVLELCLDEELGAILDISKYYNTAHIPLGLQTADLKVNKKELKKWWTNRAIPMEREGIEQFLKERGLNDTEELLLENLGLSLVDHYWLKPEHTDLTWEQVNFYQNDFSDSLNIYEESRKRDSELEYTPSYSAGGKLVKQWIIENGTRILLKNGTLPYQQEPINEVFASQIYRAAQAKIDFTEYSLRTSEKYGLLSSCSCYTSEQLEFVPAFYILGSQKKSNSISQLQHYREVCEAHGCNVEEFLNTMFVMDYLIANTDRHMNNFGILRNSETLEWIKVAPIYDNGNSLWYTTQTELISNKQDIKINSFYDTQKKQLSHATNLPELDFDELKNGDLLLKKVFMSKDSLISKERIERLQEAFREKVVDLEQVYSRFYKEKRIYFPSKYTKVNDLEL